MTLSHLGMGPLSCYWHLSVTPLLAGSKALHVQMEPLAHTSRMRGKCSSGRAGCLTGWGASFADEGSSTLAVASPIASWAPPASASLPPEAYPACPVAASGPGSMPASACAPDLAAASGCALPMDMLSGLGASCAHGDHTLASLTPSRMLCT